MKQTHNTDVIAKEFHELTIQIPDCKITSPIIRDCVILCVGRCIAGHCTDTD